ncbi:hypothetical protein AEST_06960 [Alishewanella aestuarii B11]|uniref:Uncharacterized protein n=1 Tax=Alishewanella aestuarii B11 TaxID=1197174 RepID=J1YEN1_9ALTE|nr:hypothetical protein AEST_06960 [Alishewanella aestuarii B11]
MGALKRAENRLIQAQFSRLCFAGYCCKKQQQLNYLLMTCSKFAGRFFGKHLFSAF